MLQTIVHYLKLMRWFHELVAIIPFVSLYLVISYFAQQNNILNVSPFSDFILLCLAVQLLIAAGCVLNDIMDQRIDKVNKPKTHLIGRVISIKQAWITFWLLTAALTTLSTYIAYTFFTDWWWIVILVFVLSVSYDVYFKRSPLMGNMLIALITAFIPLVLLFYSSETIAKLNDWKIELLIYLFSIYSFLIIVPRELSLDISDLEGDALDNCKTLPVLIGEKRSKNIVIGMLVLNIILAATAAFLWTHLVVIMILISAGHLYYIRLIFTAKTRLDYIKAGRFIWLILIVGLIGFTLATLV